MRAKVDELCLGVETLFADAPNQSIENASKISKDRKLWSDDDEFCFRSLVGLTKTVL